MKKPTSSLHNVNQSIIKKYICEEMNGEFIHSLYDSNTEIQDMEQRDEEISKSIQKLLSRTNNHRYFFAIGAGIFRIYFYKIHFFLSKQDICLVIMKI